MQQFPIVPRDRPPVARTVLFLLFGLGLAGAFWVATIPVATGRLMSPSEMIEAGLPPGVMIKTAGKPQFLTAVCAAVKDHRSAAPAIAKTAVAAHQDYVGDIVATVLRCSNGNCALAGAIVAAANSAAPESAVLIDDAAIATAPDCADTIQGITSHDGKEVLSDGKEILSDGKEVLPGEDVPAEGPSDSTQSPPINQPPLPGSIGGGGGFVPQGSTVQLCDNGRQRTIRSSQLAHFLAGHPGAFLGNCQVTPVTSR